MGAADSKDVDRTPVAHEIWYFSKREQAYTRHVVLNHDANRYVDRIPCKTTGAIVKYKRQNNAPTTAKVSSEKALRELRKKHNSTPKVDPEELWYQKIKSSGDQTPLPY